MKIIKILLTATLLCIGIASFALPSGSYLKTCKRCYKQDGMLYCKCQKRNGRFRHASLNKPGRCRKVINDNGHLVCKHRHRRVVTRSAGPIWNNHDAKRKCPNVCGNMRWTGQWWTTQFGNNSVCQCKRRR